MKNIHLTRLFEWAVNTLGSAVLWAVAASFVVAFVAAAVEPSLLWAAGIAGPLAFGSRPPALKPLCRTPRLTLTSSANASPSRTPAPYRRGGALTVASTGPAPAPTARSALCVSSGHRFRDLTAEPVQRLVDACQMGDSSSARFTKRIHLRARQRAVWHYEVAND